MNWKITPGAHFGAEDAPIIGERLAKLADAGILTPETVVEDARPDGSPLHDYFCWDDTEAARRYRREQARKMIQAIEIIPAEKVEPIRYFHYVRTEHDAGFATLDMVRREPAFLTQVIEAARRELIAWKKKYGQYQELEREVMAIQLAIDALAESPR